MQAIENYQWFHKFIIKFNVAMFWTLFFVWEKCGKYCNKQNASRDIDLLDDIDDIDDIVMPKGK